VPNTSATGGYLVGVGNPAVLSDAALQNFFHDWFVGISGLQAQYVRPRWQPEPPNIPDIAIDWMAFGVTEKKYFGMPAVIHHASSGGFPNGYDELIRQQSLKIMASIYGPNADQTTEMLANGMYIAQNLELLTLNNIGLVECGEPIVAPELIKEQWYYRVDLPIWLNRSIVIDYAVENILTASGTINNGIFTETFNN